MDEARFDAVIGPHLELGFRLAVTMLGDRQEAEDAVQEASLKAWRALDRLRPDSNLRAWFLTIVANQCRSIRRGRWFKLVRVPDAERSGGSAQDPAEGPAVARSDLAAGLNRLPPNDRAAIYLRFYEDLSLEETAQALGISMTAARSRIHRALQKLKLSLEP